MYTGKNSPRRLEDDVSDGMKELLSLKPSTVIRLNAEESKRFLDMIENPPEPNEALRKAMGRHDELFGDGGLSD